MDQLEGPLTESDARAACEKLAAATKYDPPSRRVAQQLRRQAIQRFVELGVQRRAAENIVSGTLGEPQQATESMMEIATDLVTWRDQDGRPFASIFRDGHDENYALDSSGLRDWLAHQYYLNEGQAPAPAVLSTVLRTLEGRARFEGDEHRSWVRVAGWDDKVYVDLGHPDWSAVEITPGKGWQIVQHPPVKFYRPDSMRPLPHPESGSIEEIYPFLNFSSDEDRMLFIGAMVTAFHPRGPYLIISLQGNPGSAKTTLARTFLRLTDPHSGVLRSAPKNLEDLGISASEAAVLAFDNLDIIPKWLSDGLCRLSTGGGFATRQLFTNRQQVVLEAQATAVLTGVGTIMEETDVLDRAIVFEIPAMDDSRRMTEEAFNARFEERMARVLGALFDGVSAALAGAGNITENLPRMADAVAFAAAAGDALGWSSDDFIAGYRQNKEHALLVSLDLNPVGRAIREMMDTTGEFTGTASELLAALNNWADQNTRREPGWPRGANRLSSLINGLDPALRRAGIAVERMKSSDRDSRKLIRLSRVDDDPGRGRNQPRLPSAERPRTLPPRTSSPERVTFMERVLAATRRTLPGFG